MTYFVSYETSHGSVNVIPYSDKDLASHAAVALRTYYNVEPEFFVRDNGVIKHLSF